MASAKGGSWVWCNDRQALISKSEYQRGKFVSTLHARSDIPTPMIVNDQLDYMLSHVDGRRYTSKRAYEKSVRAAGLTIVGNEDLTKHVPSNYDDAAHEADIHADVQRAISEAKLRT